MRTVHVIPHTHWDREWYRPYQTFRMQLVDLLDGLLPTMAADPSYAHFLLDGQMAVVDDYLEMRPEAEPVLRRLAAAGRVSMGPWYILMDEFLVSGETMVRDLALGMDRATAFGGPMEVGYLPDMFGHIAQMPQLLAQFGLDDAVVWRGVPAAIDDAAFRWEAPDGTAVRAAYLATGYSNGALAPTDAKELVEMVAGWCAEQGDRAGDPVLWMNGTDHLLPQAHLGRVLAEANDIQDDLRFEIVSLADHLAAARTADATRGRELPTWRGELRSGARSNLLMGVASNRVDVHQAESRATTVLERFAEPLAALYLPADRWPDRFLDRAWLEVIRNAAHDSICACSIDEVGRAVLHRFDEARTIGEGIVDRVLAAIAHVAGGPVVVNASARERAGLVELTLPGDEPVEGAQVVSVRAGRRLVAATSRAEIEGIAMIAAGAIDDLEGGLVEDDGDTLVLTLIASGAEPVPGAHTDVMAAAAVLRAAVERGPSDGKARIDYVGAPRQRVLVRATAVPGFGWWRFAPAPLDVEPVTATDGIGLSNGTTTVQVDPSTGTWSVDGLAGFGRIVDDGDVGDTYNWCPPARDTVVDTPVSVEATVTEAGPLRGRIEVAATYLWPEQAIGGARVGERSVVVRTSLELHAGDDLVRVRHEIDNPSRDHRVRVWFPLPSPTDHSQAECAFTVVERGLTAEGGPNEWGVPTFPSRRFVVAGGLTVAHEGLLEYELVDIDDDAGVARQLALTLLRCTGVVSQGPMASRPIPAGPTVETPAAQMRGLQHLSYAVHTRGRDPYAVAEDHLVPLLAARPRKGSIGLAGMATVPGAIDPATVPASASRGAPLTVSGAQVSSVTRTEGRVTVRVFNPTDEETVVHVEGRRGWLVDLRGRPLEPFEGSFELRPHGIATAALAD